MIHDPIYRKLTPFSANLRDETQVTIREAVVQDAAGFIRCVKTYLAESDYMVMEADEFAPDMSQGREFIQNLTESENSLLLVAVHDDRIIANLDITGGRRRRLRHTGLLGLGMLAEYRSKGLGTLLLQAGIRWAKANPMLEKLWLQILAGNKQAIALYKKLGFEEEGRQKNFVKTPEGYLDNLLMSYSLR